MSESSRSRVTITLGRSGQVVKRVGDPLSSSFIDSDRTAGGKRSVRDRLGSDFDSSGEYSSKRHRRDGGIDEIHLSKDDLRFKILQKSKLKQRQNAQESWADVTDLRNILSRPAQSSTNSLGSHPRMREPKEMRLHQMDPRDGRPHFRESRDNRQPMTTSRDSRSSIRDYREYDMLETREQRMPDPRQKRASEFTDARPSFPSTKDVSRSVREPSRSSIMGPTPVSRTANAATKAESVINSYSPWNLERLRRRSPDETLASSRVMSPTRRDGGMLGRPPVRSYDDTRARTFMSKDVTEFSRPASSLSYPTNMVPPAAQMKTMAPVVPPLLPGSHVQKSPYVVDNQLTVDGFLQSLGLEKYVINFKAEEVDMYALKQMGDSDLKDLGIPMGPRRKIMLSLQPLSKRQAL